MKHIIIYTFLDVILLVVQISVFVSGFLQEQQQQQQQKFIYKAQKIKNKLFLVQCIIKEAYLSLIIVKVMLRNIILIVQNMHLH